MHTNKKKLKKNIFFPQDHEDSPVQDHSPCHKIHHQATKRPEKGLTDRANHQIACRRKKSALRGQRRCHPQHETPFSHQFCARQRPNSRLIHGVGSGPAHFYQNFCQKNCPLLYASQYLLIAIVTPVLSTLYLKQKFLTRHAFGSFFYTAKMSCSGLSLSGLISFRKAGEAEVFAEGGDALRELAKKRLHVLVNEALWDRGPLFDDERPQLCIRGRHAV